jgi:hypothetical protein
MTDAQRKQVADAMAARKKAKEAYDRERDKIEPLRLAWVQADHLVRQLFKSLNVTKADSVFHD